MNTQVLLEQVRLSFPQIVSPRAYSTEQPKYSADFLMPAEHPGFKQFWNIVMALCAEKWQENSNSMIATMQSASKVCYGDGNYKVNQKTGEIYGGYIDNWYISSKCIDRPQLIGADRKSILDPTGWEQIARQLYGGCKVNAIIKPYLQINNGNGIRCELVAVQFAGDDEPFDANETNVDGMFDNTQVVSPKMNMPVNQGIPAPVGIPVTGVPAYNPATAVPTAPVGVPAPVGIPVTGVPAYNPATAVPTAPVANPVGIPVTGVNPQSTFEDEVPF